MAGVEPPDLVRMDKNLPLLGAPVCTASRESVSNSIRRRTLPIEASQRYDVRSCEGGGSASDGGTDSGKRVRFSDFSAEEGGRESATEGRALRSPRGGGVEGGALRSPRSPRGGGVEGGALRSPRGGGVKGGASRNPREGRISPGSSASVPSRDGKSSTRLHVGFLPLSVTQQQLLEKFSSYGNITECFVIPPKPGLSYTYGFVEYASSSSALTAMRQLHSCRWGEQCVTVQWSNGEKQSSNGGNGVRGRDISSAPSLPGNNGTGTYSVQVRRLPPTTTEAVLRRVFSRAGAVKNVQIVKLKPLSDTLSSVVGFATLEEARRAVRMLDGRAVGGYTISVKPASAAPLPQQQCAADEVSTAMVDNVRRSGMVFVPANSSQGEPRLPAGRRDTGHAHRHSRLLEHPGIPSDVMGDFPKRLSPCPPLLRVPTTSPLVTTTSSLHTDNREPPPLLIRAPLSLSTMSQTEALHYKFQKLPSLIRAPFTGLDAVPGRDSGVDSIPATSGEVSRCSSPRNGMEPSSGSCSTQGTCTHDGMECEPERAPESDSQTKLQPWDSTPTTVSLTHRNSNLIPNPHTVLPIQTTKDRSSSYVSNRLSNPDQPPPLECAPIREDSRLYSPANTQARVSQSHTPPTNQCPSVPRVDTCFPAESSPKEMAPFPTTQAAAASDRLPGQQFSLSVGRGRALLALLDSREEASKKETLAPRVMTSRASPSPKPGLGRSQQLSPPPKPGLGRGQRLSPPPKPGLGRGQQLSPPPKPGLGRGPPLSPPPKPGLGRGPPLSPPPKPGLGRGQRLYGLQQQLLGADPGTSRRERTVGSVALQRKTESQAVNPPVSTNTTQTSGVVTADFHPPSLKDIPAPVTCSSPTATAAVTAASPLLPPTADPQPQKQLPRKAKKPKIAAVFSGSSRTVSSPLRDTPSPLRADSPDTRSPRAEIPERGSPTSVKSPRREDSGARRIIGLSQQPDTQTPTESPPPPLLESPEGRLAAPSNGNSPIQECRSSSECSPRSEHYQTVSSSDELEGWESRWGRNSHEIEKSIALHQRNIHRWQVEVKRLQQKNANISQELSREAAEAAKDDGGEEDIAVSPERLRSFDRMLELQSQFVTEVESTKRREIDRELILMKGQQKYMCDNLSLMELKLELEAGDVWDKLSLAKQENKALRAKAELFI